MKTILISGGAGFIGSHLAKKLSERPDHRIVIVDQFGTGDKWNNLVRVPIDEIIHPDDLFYWLEHFGESLECVFQLGGVSSSIESDVEVILDSNHNTPLLLWRWCAEHNVRYVYGSSYEVYGDGAHGFDDTSDEAYQRNLRPLNPNGWSKKLLDLHISTAQKRGEPMPPQCVGLRLFNIYGPNEYHKKDSRSVALKIYEEASTGAAVKLFKSNNPNYAHGEQIRDFVHIDDVVSVLEFFYDNPDKSGLFNIGSGKAHSFEELAKAIFAALGKAPNIKYVDMPTHVEHQYQYKTLASIARLREAGYSKEFKTLEQGIADYIGNYLTKPDKYL